jgi:restriction system protein
MEDVGTTPFKKITLLDMESFFDLWVKYYDELSQEARNRLPLKSVYFLNMQE